MAALVLSVTVYHSWSGSRRNLLSIHDIALRGIEYRSDEVYRYGQACNRVAFEAP